MGATEEIERIALDPVLSVPEKDERIIAFLAQSDDRGVPAAVECLMTTSDRRVSEYVAAYLGLIHGAREEKARVAERLRGAGEVAASAARLVPWMPDSLIDAFIQDHLAAADPESPVSSVVFAIAMHRPERLRPYADQVESAAMKRSLLSGAPDEFADSLLERWRAEHDLNDLWTLALIRTSHAADLIESVMNEVADPNDWDWLMPLAGRLPDTRKPAGFPPAFLGFVADAGESAHVMGGDPGGDVPLCADCRAPAERILTLSAEAMPNVLSRDPSFYWFTCECAEVDRITVRFTSAGTEVYFNPQGPSSGESRLIPGERSLVLEPHPNQHGVSLPAFPRTQHQVGGLPRWPSPETHPICPVCGNYMPFLMAIEGGSTPFGRMGFEELLFGFWCDSCAVSSTQTQN
ncbi:hypothetical protein SAMN05216215_105451 [Saccharopolyspora shandongensis]|uniref:DUF1963 domain-containing protein n=1 Tax=Saccharopolyspora shandongensis TaxID=418495 RepID=A0A1H3RK35_9PSEU|nr:hypothetical protein [Saccharopolyspora shandongensis]SDZ25598.1 hypothetical protein SAMN05216215_105451 [Saccharopolyspora shandongensis]